jgi:hypothetical protein
MIKIGYYFYHGCGITAPVPFYFHSVTENRRTDHHICQFIIGIINNYTELRKIIYIYRIFPIFFFSLFVYNMACSKMILGNLPELTKIIIQYFWDDISALHSCILVNRLWCRMAIPLLWEDPFSKKHPKNFNFINIYLHKLNEHDKTRLNKYGINNNIFPSNTLFNYTNFIKCLSTQNMYFSIKNWCETCDRSIGLIFLLLIKIFIENEVKLHTFEIEVEYTFRKIDYDRFNSISELISQNPNFINNIKNLKFHFNEDYINSNFLKCFYSNCNLISSLYFKFSEDKYFKYGYYKATGEQLLQIINSQKNLEKIYFGYNNLLHGNLSSSDLLLHKILDSNNSNTLKTIIFHGINFKNLPCTKEVFEQLNVLEIHIINCHFLNSSFIQQIIDITKPFKLKSLFMIYEEGEKLQIDLIKLLFQKSGEYLENIGFKPFITDDFKENLLDLIKIYCKRIKFYDLNVFNIQSAYSILDIIKNFNQNLNYLSIDIHNYNYNFMYDYKENIELSSIILLNLAKILPRKLGYLNLELGINNTSNDLELFLKNSKDVFIEKLLFRIDIFITDIIPCIKESITKEKRVEFLAIEGYYNNYRSDLFNMKDVKKEFESYNIKVKQYNCLYIKAYKFIDEMY